MGHTPIRVLDALADGVGLEIREHMASTSYNGRRSHPDRLKGGSGCKIRGELRRRRAWNHFEDLCRARVRARVVFGLACLLHEAGDHSYRPAVCSDRGAHLRELVVLTASVRLRAPTSLCYWGLSLPGGIRFSS